MLHLKNINLSFGERVLFRELDWVMPVKRRAALIGPNGAGKTTLLKIITKELQPDDGIIIKPANYQIGYLPQEEIEFDAESVLFGAMQGLPELLRLEQEIEHLRRVISSNTDDSMALEKLGSLEHEFEMAGGYKMEGAAKSVLSGLGFKTADFHRNIEELSGGWRMRVYLARLLLQNPDLLLLDEPTNHLDLASLEWLEQYLTTFEGSVVIVSHDRFFIDRIAQEIYELDGTGLTKYVGNYHQYEQQKEHNRELLQKKSERQAKEIQRQQVFIDRFRYKNTKATQVQSRIKQLEKMERIDAPNVTAGNLTISLRTSTQSYKDVLHLKNVAFRYDREWIFKDVEFSVYRGDKLALVGENGAGKTTLTRLITGQLEPQRGEMKIGERVSIGYYAQHQVDALNYSKSVYEEIESTVAAEQIPNIRNILGLFGFHGDQVYKPISVLSGGEKARVSLTKILLSPVNLLIMDEPTNHLDIRSKEALEQALAVYDGTLILISHDRYFLDRIVNRVIEMKDKTLKQFQGNYSDYLSRKEKETTIVINKANGKLNDSRMKKREQAAARQAISQRRKELTLSIQHSEKEIHDLEQQKQILEQKFSDPDFYKSGDKAAAEMARYQDLKAQIEHEYQAWEEAQLELDRLLESINSG